MLSLMAYELHFLGVLYCLYSKYRFLVVVKNRPISAVLRVPTIFFVNELENTNVYPCNPSFFI